VRRRSGLKIGLAATVEPVGLEVRNLPKPVEGPTLFGNARPIEIEIGTGKGTFLAEESSRRQDVNFIGVERADRYWRHASDRLRRRECWNARVVLVEAGYFLTEFVSDESIAAVHVHFPDPWPKKRHHKRRLIQSSFILQVERILVPGGRLQVVTDHDAYYAQMQKVISASSLVPGPYTPPASADGDGFVAGSNFERKYHRMGKRIYALAAVKN